MHALFRWKIVFENGHLENRGDEMATSLTGCENGMWMDLRQCHVQWRDSMTWKILSQIFWW